MIHTGTKLSFVLWSFITQVNNNRFNISADDLNEHHLYYSIYTSYFSQIKQRFDQSRILRTVRSIQLGNTRISTRVIYLDPLLTEHRV